MSNVPDLFGESRDTDVAMPLAARMRPRSLDEFFGQTAIVGPDGPIPAMVQSGHITSFILWGPPGSGKTTLARLVAESVDGTFVPFSAVTEGVKRVREIIAEAQNRRAATGRTTILFCDEIHRFNKSQQDAFLPHVEAGDVVLIGATTENPSFEIVRPLLSRAPVMVLEPLSKEDLVAILTHAMEDEERGLGGHGLRAADGVLEDLAELSDGDARRALGVIERAAVLAKDGVLTRETIATAAQHRFAVYDKDGESHYNQISALHKAIRGGDPDGALYWLARMLEGGDDPLYIARRLVRMAVEDIGLAQPDALKMAVAARDAYHFLGSPEGELALAQAAVFMAASPKSNRLYKAWKQARRRAKETPSLRVPLHLRNAPTGLMKDLGYGAEYQYDPDATGGISRQHYLPEDLVGERFYEPGEAGWEERARQRLETWRQIRNDGGTDG